MKTFWVNGLNKMGIESGDYVLASEAKDQDDWNVKKLKELELEQIKANERIKVLEDALIIALDLYREIQGSHKASIGSLQSHYTPQLRVELTDTAANFIRAAMEVKP